MKHFSLLTLLLALSLNLSATTLSIPEQFAIVGEEITIELKGADLPAAISALQGSLEWDEDILQLKSVESSVFSAMQFNTGDASKLGFIWSDFPGVELGINNDLVVMTFEIMQSGRSDIRFVNTPTSIEMGDGAFQPVSLTLIDGGVEALDALPVELSSFEATSENKAVKLDWITASEVDFEGFEIERSLDGIDFNNIAWLDARGTEDAGSVYGYLDEEITFNTTHYYRLKMWDWDGTFEYSPIVNAKVIQEDLPVIQVFPNPAKSKAAIVFENFSDLTNEPVITTLHDINGRVIQQISHDMQNGINQIELDVAGLAVGMYTITIEHAGYFRTDKLIIQ